MQMKIDYANLCKNMRSLLAYAFTTQKFTRLEKY